MTKASSQWGATALPSPSKTPQTYPRSGSLIFLAACLHLCHNDTTTSLTTQIPPSAPHASRYAAWGGGTSEVSTLTPVDAQKEALPADSHGRT